MSNEQSAPIQAAPEAEPVESQVQPQAAPEVNEGLKPDNFLAPKFAALTRKERQVREAEKAIKAREAELEKMRSEYEGKFKASQESESQFMEKLKKSPLKTLKEMGLTFEQLTEMQMNDENPTVEMQMRSIEEKLRKEMEEKYGKLSESIKEKEEREANERVEAAKNGYKSELQTFIKQNSEKYELVNSEPDAIELMYEVAEKYYEQTGKIPSSDDVASAVEEHYEEKAKQILSLKKFQAAQKPSSEPKEKEAAPTLSNTHSATVPKSGIKSMSDEDSKKEAAKLIRWND